MFSLESVPSPYLLFLSFNQRVYIIEVTTERLSIQFIIDRINGMI